MASNAEMIQGGFAGLGQGLNTPELKGATDVQKWLGERLASGMTVQEAAIEYKLMQQNGQTPGAQGSHASMQAPGGVQARAPAPPMMGGAMGGGLSNPPAAPPAPAQPPMQGTAPHRVTVPVPRGFQGNENGPQAEAYPPQERQAYGGGRGPISSGPAGMGQVDNGATRMAQGRPPPIETQADFESILRAAPELARLQTAQQPKRRSLEEELAIVMARGDQSRQTEGVKGGEARKTQAENNKSKAERQKLSIAAKKALTEFSEGEAWRRQEARLAALLARVKEGRVTLADKSEADRLHSANRSLVSAIARLRSSNVEILDDPEAADQIREWEEQLQSNERLLEEIRQSKGQPTRGSSGGGKRVRDPKTGRTGTWDGVSPLDPGVEVIDG